MRHALLLLFAAALAQSAMTQAAEPAWQKLPPIPDAEGFAGAFAGTSGGALLVAGGANIVGDKWGDTFTKKWYDSVFVLEQPAGAWKLAGRLPRPLGYGVTISVPGAMFCLGGSDEHGHSREVFSLHFQDGKFDVVTGLPPLPRRVANHCGAVVGRVIYLAGGIETPTSTKALHTFWAFDLAEPSPKWRELPPWPGPERMLAVAAAHEGAFYLFSGASLAADSDGKPVRTFLQDAYRYTPAKGWERLADLPRPAVAAPSPAIPAGSELLVLTGDDGQNVTFSPVEKHPGFPRDILAYDVRQNRWRHAGETPFSRATVPVVPWQNLFVIPNGEVRPRVRTNEVWGFKPAAP